MATGLIILRPIGSVNQIHKHARNLSFSSLCCGGAYYVNDFLDCSFLHGRDRHFRESRVVRYALRSYKRKYRRHPRTSPSHNMSSQATNSHLLDANTPPFPLGAPCHTQNQHFEHSNINYVGRDQYNRHGGGKSLYIYPISCRSLSFYPPG
jgi:hypothetical protein